MLALKLESTGHSQRQRLQLKPEAAAFAAVNGSGYNVAG
jgi:hypothetical protein